MDRLSLRPRKTDNEFEEPEFDLLLDGNAIEDVDVRGYGDYGDVDDLRGTFRQSSLERIRQLDGNSILGLMRHATFFFRVEGGPEGYRMEAMYIERHNAPDEGKDVSNWPTHSGQNFKLATEFHVSRWARRYSVSELVDRIKLGASTETDIAIASDPFPYIAPFGMAIEATVDLSRKIHEILDEFQPRLRKLIADAEAELANPDKNSVVSFFEFPEAVRPACEQYLLYFGQFLRDLGINAETELKEQASKVLFTITPKDRGQALDSIREALSCYLEMPGAPAGSMSGDPSEIALIQLNANILHLRSQVMLANAVLQAKNAAISAHQSEIALLRENLNLRDFAAVSPKASDSEEIIEGVLAVKKMEYKGFEVNTPEILRRLKRIRK
jgi:hypothetical protein